MGANGSWDKALRLVPQGCFTLSWTATEPPALHVNADCGSFVFLQHDEGDEGQDAEVRSVVEVSQVLGLNMHNRADPETVELETVAHKRNHATCEKDSKRVCSFLVLSLTPLFVPTRKLNMF